MGNRMTMSFEADAENTCVYTQWNGGPESVMALVQYARETQAQGESVKGAYLRTLKLFASDGNSQPAIGTFSEWGGAANYDNGHYSLSTEWELSHWPEGWDSEYPTPPKFPKLRDTREWQQNQYYNILADLRSLLPFTL